MLGRDHHGRKHHEPAVAAVAYFGENGAELLPLAVGRGFKGQTQTAQFLTQWRQLEVEE